MWTMSGHSCPGEPGIFWSNSTCPPCPEIEFLILSTRALCLDLISPCDTWQAFSKCARDSGCAWHLGQVLSPLPCPMQAVTILTGRRLHLAFSAKQYSAKERYWPEPIQKLLAGERLTSSKALPWSLAGIRSERPRSDAFNKFYRYS